MTGLFEGGEEVLLAVGYYATRRPERGDVVVYRGRSALLKSVRAVEGDRFAVRREGAQLRLVLQGEVARTSRGEPYSLDETAGRILGLYERDYGGVVPRGACLLLGNTPTGSYDSTRLGLVSVADLEGRVLARVRR